MTKQLTQSQVRALGWPRTLLDGQALTAKEAYEVGKLIVNRLQGGAALHAQTRRDWSLRSIASALNVSSTATLGRCVQVYWVCEELGIASRLEQIPPHLLITAARLPVKQQLAFINKGVKEGWTRNGAIAKATEALATVKPTARTGKKATAAEKAAAKVAKTREGKSAVRGGKKTSKKAGKKASSKKTSKKVGKKASSKKASKKKSSKKR